MNNKRNNKRTAMNEKCSRITLIISLCLALFSLSACSDPKDTAPGPVAGPAPESKPAPQPNTKMVDMTSKPEPAVSKDPMTPQQQIAYAQADLANRLGLDPAGVSVISISSGPVTWRSGALGCPKPGMNYTQALVPGFRIIVQSGNTTFHYHAKSGGQPFYCPQDRIETPAGNSAYE
jgi:hypothetical protein